MHGVKRLFSWMIPRFDRDRFNVSLVSLRKKDLSEETLDALGVDITYLERGKFDPLTLPALLRIIDAKRIDILHLHGYGATTFGRLAAALRGIPTILHEHANLTDTPWFQKVADRLLEPVTDIALAVSREHGRLRRRRAQDPGVEGQGRLPRRAPGGVQPRARAPAEIAAARRELGIGAGEFAVGTVTRLHDSKGNSYLVDAAARVVRDGPARASSSSAKGRLLRDLQAQAAGARARRSVRVRRVSPRCGRHAVGVRPERVSVALGRHARSRRSKRWRWGSRSSPPTPTACSTS